MAQKAGELLNEIVPSIVKTADLVAEITHASEEQATGANQITMGMNQLNEVTQMTASSAEELASTSEALNEHARGLQKMIGFFRLRGSSGPAAPKETLPETALLKAPAKAENVPIRRSPALMNAGGPEQRAACMKSAAPPSFSGFPRVTSHFDKQRLPDKITERTPWNLPKPSAHAVQSAGLQAITSQTGS